MFCPNCGTKITEGDKFCVNCGYRLPVTNGSNPGAQNQGTQNQGYQYHGNKGGSQTIRNGGSAFSMSSLVNKLNDYIGNERKADLNWRVLFSDVTKKHSTSETEEMFACGTAKTTPSASQVSKEWPHPWLYSRVLLMFLAAFALLWICCSWFGNPKTIPGMIVVGSFAVPLATLVLFMELNAWRNVSLFKVIQVFLVGGCASIVVTLIIGSFYPVGELNYLGALVTGIIEELGKGLIVYYFIKKFNKFNILTAMLIGASVGAGFAAFESAGYAFTAGLGAPYDMLGAMYTNIIIRGLLAPGGHVAWASITGAALVIAAKARGEFSTSIFSDSRFLRLFILPILLHALWDSPLAQIGSQIFLAYIILTVIAWIILLILVNMGLAEVEREAA